MSSGQRLSRRNAAAPGEPRIAGANNDRDLASFTVCRSADGAEIGNVEVGGRAAEAMPQVVVGFLGKRGDALRRAGTGPSRASSAWLDLVRGWWGSSSRRCQQGQQPRRGWRTISWHAA